MKLKEYLEKNEIEKKQFARTLKCSPNYIYEICQGKKPGPKLIKAIVKATDGAVTKENLLAQKDIDNKTKQKYVSPNYNERAPHQDSISPHCINQIVPNLEHKKPITISLLVDGKVLFTKVLHSYIQDGKEGYNYCDDNLKLKCRIVTDHIEKFNEILEQGIPPVDPDNIA